MKDQDFEFIRNLVIKKSGISLSKDKIYLIKTRLEPILKNNNYESIVDLVADLRWKNDPALIEAVIDVMTTNETFFFRDMAPYDAMKDRVLPNYIKERAALRTLTIWCAACSSGQEPYSIAMLIREHFPELAEWNVSIIGTDISGSILEKARKGVYSQFEINRGLPPRFKKYFEKHKRGWQILPEIRNAVEFKKSNLIEDMPVRMHSADIVFLRNVLIYFELDVKKAILNQIQHIIKPDGVLFLGQSETVAQLNVPFEACRLGTASCFRYVPEAVAGSL